MLTLLALVVHEPTLIAVTLWFTVFVPVVTGLGFRVAWGPLGGAE